MGESSNKILKNIVNETSQSFRSAADREAKGLLSEISRQVRQNFGIQGEVVGGKPIQTTFDSTEPDGVPLDELPAENGREEGEAPAQLFTARHQDADATLAIAVAAWRMLNPGAGLWIVGQNSKTGEAFCGRSDDLTNHCRENRQSEEEWETWSDVADPDENECDLISDLPCDSAAAKAILLKISLEDLDKQAGEYAKQHLGDSPTVVQHLALDGVTAPLQHFGVMRGTAYTAKKDGKIDNYFHVHGESTGVFPDLYRLDDHTAVIHSPVAIFKDGWLDD